MAVTNSLRNLHLDIQGPTEGVKPGGEAIERQITLYNQGDLTADLELGIEPSDARSRALLNWYEFDKSDADLRLAPQDNIQVTLRFVAPLQAESGFYSYDVLLRSRQYPDDEIRRSQQLQVLPSDQETLRTEPRTVLSPETYSTAPLLLTPQTPLALSLTVENPSLRTDRFFVSCPDLSPEWFSVIYPESDTNLPGLVSNTDGLQLNPRETGIIQLNIHPPAHAPAGSYFPTLRIVSANSAERVMLEIIYFTIPLDDRLALGLSPDSRKLPAAEDFFDVTIHNMGNIERDILLTAYDEEHKLAYDIFPEHCVLRPGETQLANLRPRPKHRWRQLWRLRNQTIDFTVAGQNAVAPEAVALAQKAELAALAAIEQAVAADLSTLQPQLPATQVGQIYWKSRRRWLFWLLVAALALGLLTGTVLALWYVLFWRPSLRPQVAQFSTAQETYQESLTGNEPAIALDWDITNAKQISRLVLVVQQPASADPLEQYFPEDSERVGTSNALEDLEPFCTVGETEAANSVVANLLQIHRRLARRAPNTEVLRCRSVAPATLVTEEGSYSFELRVFSAARGDEHPITVRTLDVVVGPPPPPQIQALAATATEFSVLPAGSEGVSLAPAARPDPNEVAVAPSPNQTPEPTAGLERLDVPQPSDASAEAEAGLQPGAEAVETASNPTQPASTATPIAPVTPLPQGNGDRRPIGPIRLNWDIANVKTIEDVAELKLSSLAPDGSENTEPVVFDFNAGMPAALAPYCLLQESVLSCRQVPTTATAVGDYVFHLTLTPTRQSGETPKTLSTPTIPIKPPPPQILAFAVNGELAITKPKQVLVVNPDLGSLDIELTWAVQHGIQTEILPAPGAVQGNALTYTVSAAPGSEMITLRVINELDEETTQTVIVEKVGPAARSPGGMTGPPLTGMPRVIEGLPPPPVPTIVPVPISPLPPAELPPRPN